MTPEEKRAYSRGYNTGSAGRWPAHRPPRPPDELTATLMEAAQGLRDAVDGELATLEDSDDWQTTLGNPMDSVDEALAAIGNWLTDPTSHELERKM